MPEKIIRLEGPDKNWIYGRLWEGGNRKLVFHIHGMTHHAAHLLEVTGSEFFEEKNYDHFSISLYARFSDSRKLHQSTLSTHVKDLQIALVHFRDKYDEIFISAHSLGGLVTVMWNPPGIKAISLWDPSTDVTNFWASGPYLLHMPERRQYQLDYGNIFVLGEDMVEEIKLYPNEKCLEIAKRIKTPTQFIIPELSIALASPHVKLDAYADAFGGTFDLARIAGADHVFSNRGNRQALFNATLAWFEKFRDK